MKKCRRKKKCIVCKNISPVQHQAQVASLHFAFFLKISVDANRGNNMESQQYADCKHSIYKHIYLCIITPWQLNDKSPVICIAHYMNFTKTFQWCHKTVTTLYPVHKLTPTRHWSMYKMYKTDITRKSIHFP